MYWAALEKDEELRRSSSRFAVPCFLLQFCDLPQVGHALQMERSRYFYPRQLQEGPIRLRFDLTTPYHVSCLSYLA